ncbi:hypothetical protein B0A52_09197 [Exophiala mesophila]|uniref:PHD-type domain-containing protein n=1 Tax=Exophiala mesophila TaxID=212818 RepID=A0A438MTK0_EXOME|nr:hypothetical protein B0A52_09197 [Exophiala mesophila]
MATRSLRQRSSRYSSPATFGDREPAVKTVEIPEIRNGLQTSLDTWIEPAVRPAVPSYQDTKGLEKGGVLENMQPLGIPPSQKLLQKLKLTPYIRPSLQPTSIHVDDTHTPTPDLDKPDVPAAPREPEISSQLPPDPPRLPDTIVISSPPRGRPSMKEVASMPQAPNYSPSSVRSSFTTPGNHASPKPVSIQEHIRQDRLNSHVEHAVQQAQDKGSLNLVMGLRRLRDDAQVIPDLWNVLEAVISQSPTDQQFKIFKRYIKSGVKSFRRQSHVSLSPEQTPAAHDSTHADITSGPRLYFGAPDPNDQDYRESYVAPLFRPTRQSQDHNWTSASTVGQVPAPVDPVLRTSARKPNSSSNKRKRSRSVSSVSSLSSAQSLTMPDEFGTTTDHGRSNGIHHSATRSRSNGTRLSRHQSGASTRLRSSANPATHVSLPNQTGSEAHSSSKATSKKARRSQIEPEYEIDELSKRKARFLGESFHDYNTFPHQESHIRDPVDGGSIDPFPDLLAPPPPVLHDDYLHTSQTALILGTALENENDTLVIGGPPRRRLRKDSFSDPADAPTPFSRSSPGPGQPAPAPGVTHISSRGTTPRATRFQAPTRGARRSARVFISPNKPKNGGITAGISRAGAGRDPGTSHGAESGTEDNDELCYSCSGEGILLCCDGCTNSFHHACLEPPLNPDHEVEGSWYCPSCAANRAPEEATPTGILGLVLGQIDKTIPKAFTLPLDVRDYFEGVRTGEEGEYEEVALPRTQNNLTKMNRAGFIEEPNYKELRDSKGKLIMCYLCGHTSQGRDIIPCDFCPARWHLDCVSPPLAIPPRRRGDNKPGSSWKCPLHVDHDVASFSRQAEAEPGSLGRVPKLRRPKNAIPLDVPFPRGFKNNGIIEVELMPDTVTFDRTKQEVMDGKIYRVPEEGIRLDFIDRVKKSWYEDQSFPRQMNAEKHIRSKKYRPDNLVLHHPPTEYVVKMKEPDFWTGSQALAITETARANANLRSRSFREQQTVLNLAELSQQGINGFSGDALAELTNSLISEAPPEVADSMEISELEQLLQLQDLVSKRLALLGYDNRSAATSYSASFEGSNSELSPRSVPPVLAGKAVATNGEDVSEYPPLEEPDNDMHVSP